MSHGESSYSVIHHSLCSLDYHYHCYYGNSIRVMLDVPGTEEQCDLLSSVLGFKTLSYSSYFIGQSDQSWKRSVSFLHVNVLFSGPWGYWYNSINGEIKVLRHCGIKESFSFCACPLSCNPHYVPASGGMCLSCCSFSKGVIYALILKSAGSNGKLTFFFSSLNK